MADRSDRRRGYAVNKRVPSRPLQRLTPGARSIDCSPSPLPVCLGVLSYEDDRGREGGVHIPILRLMCKLLAGSYARAP